MVTILSPDLGYHPGRLVVSPADNEVARPNAACFSLLLDRGVFIAHHKRLTEETWISQTGTS
jgi:hypothetical protein